MGWFRSKEERYTVNDSARGALNDAFNKSANLKEFQAVASKCGLTAPQLAAYWEDKSAEEQTEANNWADALGANDWGDPPAGYPLFRVLASLALTAFFGLCLYMMIVLAFYMPLQKIHEANPNNEPMPMFCTSKACYWFDWWNEHPDHGWWDANQTNGDNP